MSSCADYYAPQTESKSLAFTVAWPSCCFAQELRARLWALRSIPGAEIKFTQNGPPMLQAPKCYLEPCNVTESGQA
eukprot:5098566-Pleurochrysis_carterae.AAC.1